jgi:hypothetical protein
LATFSFFGHRRLNGPRAPGLRAPRDPANFPSARNASSASLTASSHPPAIIRGMRPRALRFINQMETMSPAKLAGSDHSSDACDIIERSRGPPCKVPSIS